MGARSERDITRVSGTLSPSSILGGRTILNFTKNLANSPQLEKSTLRCGLAQLSKYDRVRNTEASPRRHFRIFRNYENVEVSRITKTSHEHVFFPTMEREARK